MAEFCALMQATGSPREFLKSLNIRPQGGPRPMSTP